MSNQCHALLPRLDGKPRRRRWCLASPASEHDFVCELGHVTRRPVCASHTPVYGRPANGDLWHCRECPVIAAEGQVFLSAWDEERRKAELLTRSICWVHYVTDSDHRRRMRGREREGHLLTIGREPKTCARHRSGRGRTVWIVPDDCWSDRLFVRAWWDPDDPERSYSLEAWQGVPLPVEPVDAAPFRGDRAWYECDQHFAELQANDDQLRRITASEPLMSEEARRIWVDGEVDDLPQASETVLVEIRFLLDEDDRRENLLTRRNGLLVLIDRCLKRRT
jgi:hypothetical protein